MTSALWNKQELFVANFAVENAAFGNKNNKAVNVALANTELQLSIIRQLSFESESADAHKKKTVVPVTSQTQPPRNDDSGEPAYPLGGPLRFPNGATVTQEVTRNLFSVDTLRRLLCSGEIPDIISGEFHEIKSRAKFKQLVQSIADCGDARRCGDEYRGGHLEYRGWTDAAFRLCNRYKFTISMAGQSVTSLVDAQKGGHLYVGRLTDYKTVISGFDQNIFIFDNREVKGAVLSEVQKAGIEISANCPDKVLSHIPLIRGTGGLHAAKMGDAILDEQGRLAWMFLGYVKRDDHVRGKQMFFLPDYTVLGGTNPYEVAAMRGFQLLHIKLD